MTKSFKGDRYLVRPFTSKFHVFAFIPTSVIVSTPHAVIFSERNSLFSILQSQTHELWTRFFGSSLKVDPRYTPSDCFETFPFPIDWEKITQLEELGKEYYEYRAKLMINNNQGLTATYNRFHDPNEYDHAILKLRELHDQMDRSVLDAYGWQDITINCEFLLEDEDEDESSTGAINKKGGKKNPYRYRWIDDIHDEVLARLLALNEERYQEEVLRGDKKEGKSKKAKGKTSSSPSIPNFFNK